MKNKINPPLLSFEKALVELLEKSKKGAVSVKTFLTALSGRGKVIILVIITLFFSQLPGIAIPFGIYLCYLGLRIAFNRSWIWLPKFILKLKIPSGILRRVLNQLVRFLKFLERWTSPRLHKLARPLPNGLAIAAMGLILALAPPVPLIGFAAYFAVFLISIGILNSDGIYTLLGYISGLFYLSFVTGTYLYLYY